MAAIALLAPDALAYRTAADLKDFEGTARVRWSTSRIDYERSEHSTAELSPALQDEIWLRALSTWSDVACSDIAFNNNGSTVEAAAPADARNTIQWVREHWGDRGAPDDAAAVTDVQYERDEAGDWHIVEADIYLNAEHHRWSLLGEVDGTRSLEAVATHEAGHLLGLLHPCELDGNDAPACEARADDRSVMHPAYDAMHLQLTADDVEGVCWLYPAADCGECPADTACTPNGCEELCFGRTCRADEECTDNGCEAAGGGEGGSGNSETARRGQYGETCKADRVCASGHCLDGSCTQRCFEDDDCHESAHCDTSATPPVCVDDRRELGSDCNDASECRGNECLAGAEAEPICSQACGLDHADCPRDWKCQSVEERRVCVPQQRLEAGGGCSIRPPTAPATPAAFAALLALIAASIRRSKITCSMPKHRRLAARFRDNAQGTLQ